MLHAQNQHTKPSVEWHSAILYAYCCQGGCCTILEREREREKRERETQKSSDTLNYNYLDHIDAGNWSARCQA